MRAIFNALFVKKCEFCDRIGFKICPECLTKISNLKYSQDGVPYFLTYQDEKIRKLLWKIKYRNEHSLAKDLARILSDFIYDQVEELLQYQNKKIYIIPAPITPDPKKYRLRNHMLSIANEVSKQLQDHNIDAKTYDCMIKKTKTRQAMIHGKKKRVTHIKKVLFLQKEPPLDGVIFIIDDITTTGATLLHMKSLLPKKVPVQVVALAH